MQTCLRSMAACEADWQLRETVRARSGAKSWTGATSRAYLSLAGQPIEQQRKTSKELGAAGRGVRLDAASSQAESLRTGPASLRQDS